MLTGSLLYSYVRAVRRTRVSPKCMWGWGVSILLEKPSSCCQTMAACTGSSS